MREEEFRKLIGGTSDAAFVVNSEGVVVACNEAAQQICTVRRAASKRHPLESFDLQVQPVDGEQWCNVSVVIAESNSSTEVYAIHIVRPVDLRKRLEMVFPISSFATQSCPPIKPLR